MTLDDGSRVAVIGGGPAGSFFSFFLLEMAHRVGREIHVDVYEPRDFKRIGPGGCNMCGGIVSESLIQNLAAEGLELPDAVVQRQIDSYYLHMDVGSTRIETPLHEKRIAAVHRGAGPQGSAESDYESLDGHLLDRAVEKGAQVIQKRATEISFENGRPRVEAPGEPARDYDLLVAATGINSAALRLFEKSVPTYRRPKSEKAYICEFYLGQEMIKTYVGTSMHVFLLNIPRLEFAAIIPKGDFITLCLLGRNVDQALIDAFLNAPEVKECMPPHWRPPDRFCHCSPRISTLGAREPFADRALFIGDCGTTRLYKDGIGAAYRTAKAAATTAIFEGLSAGDFRRHFLPVCRRIEGDNRLGRLVFLVTRLIQKWPAAQLGVWRMIAGEKRKRTLPRMSLVLWDTFTGSAPYRTVLMRTFHPGFNLKFLWEIIAGQLALKPGRRIRMATGATGAMGRSYADGEVIYHQGDRSDCMYVVQRGEVEMIQRKGDNEFRIALLSDGDLFGEMALFDEERRPATVRAVGEAWVYTLEKGSLLRRIHEDPSLAFRMIQKMSGRIQDLETSLIRMASVPTD
jgi:flavin-dependent dehydrogenase